MKIAALIARNLLGLIFVVFGLNGFLHFIPQPPPPAGPAMQFLGALSASGYMVPVFGLQIIGGALLLANRFVPIALVLLAPVIVNILLYSRADGSRRLAARNGGAWCFGCWFLAPCAPLLRAFWR